tara:strand:- start:2178 stop:2606 length:429 start_codon:yes stop_codon:yes gene_type:complete
MNDTLLKFNYKKNLIKEYSYWMLLIRENQITIGSLVLISKSEYTSMSNECQEAIAELFIIFKDIEDTLTKVFSMEKINYLVLMMVDKHNHFHVIPRYSKPVKFHNQIYKDLDWPKPPNLMRKVDISDNILNKIIIQIQEKIN